MQNFAIFKSVDAPSAIPLEDLHFYAEHIISTMVRPEQSLPPILVMYVSESAAAVVGVEGTGIVRHNRSNSSELSSYYELWLVGEAGIADYILALQGIMLDSQTSGVYGQHQGAKESYVIRH
jgi:hypothetical protein